MFEGNNADTECRRLVGNIYANPGFVDQFGTGKNSDGDTVITAPIMATWQNISSVGQIIGMMTMPFFSDRFERKYAMYAYWYVDPGVLFYTCSCIKLQHVRRT
jgi:hypothetical protein